MGWQRRQNRILFAVAAAGNDGDTLSVGYPARHPEVIAVGADYLLYTSLGFACWAFQFVFMRALQGAGDMLVPMVIGISAALFTIPLAIGLANHTDLGPSGIWIAQLANSVVTTVAFSLRIASRRWTEKRL